MEKMGVIEKLTLASWRWSLIYDVVDVVEITTCDTAG